MTKREEIKSKNTVDIHGKEYLTVAGRVELAHETNKEHLSIVTEYVPHNSMIVIKATVTTNKGTFTGFSAANPLKPIEKMSPFEVAETSAIGRALGFAGFGIVEGIATADEMVKSQAGKSTSILDDEGWTRTKVYDPAPTNAEAYKPNEWSEPKPDKLTCPHPDLKVMQVKKEGPNLGKWFENCERCGKFIKWVPTPIS